ncbi:hypothetical protein [Altibacter sp. HG106]|uniref:hypothetical protein n=1 Tax=Altibacter sp. HG106 TaxID=3023937 RepID=UPI00235062F6|nr:hypothetical protein [Altibacter sp. HG106]MDC7996367.1 hypothetical protein [Altibacter sp. HG106]
MNRLDKIKLEGVKVNLVQTNEFLTNLFSKKEFTIKSKYPTINTIKCTLEKGNRSFKYSAGEILPKGPPVKYQHKSYGYQDPFELISEDYHFIAYNGAGSINLKIGKGFTSTGEIRDLKSKSFDNLTGIHRAIIPKPKFHNFPIRYIKSEGFNVGSSIRVAGYFLIKINNRPFGIYDYKINEIESLFIENYDNLPSNDFENYISAIIYCFGIVSGQLFRDEVVILKYASPKFEKIIAFNYKKLEDSMKGIPALDPQLYWQLSETNKIRPYLEKEVFENLVNKSLKDLRLYRAIRIMSESCQYPIEIKASTYSVALETVKNIIIEENGEKINPFKLKKKASKTIKELKKIVDAIPESEFNSKKMVLNKLEQLNQVGNKDSLLLSFKLLNIKLSEDDKRCINMRNDFLHGRIPFDIENDPKAYELHHIVYKLHLLVCSLILKYSGFSGLMLNNIKLADLLHFDKKLREPLFRKI